MAGTGSCGEGHTNLPALHYQGALFGKPFQTEIPGRGFQGVERVGAPAVPFAVGAADPCAEMP